MGKWFLIALAACTAGGSLTDQARALEVISIEFVGDVTRWDFPSGSESYETSTPSTQGFGSMAKLADGSLVVYRTAPGGSFVGPPSLFSVDVETGLLSLLVPSPNQGAAERIVALTEAPSGSLFGFDNARGFVSIDASTLVATDLSISVSNGPTLRGTGGLATNSQGEIHGWASNSDGQTGLYRFNEATSSAERIGVVSYSVNSAFNALAFDPNDRLYGFTDTNAGNAGGDFERNAIYEIDLVTGEASLVRSGLSVLASIRGAEFLPIPEPGTTALALLALGSAVLTGHRRSLR